MELITVIRNRTFGCWLFRNLTIFNFSFKEIIKITCGVIQKGRYFKYGNFCPPLSDVSITHFSLNLSLSLLSLLSLSSLPLSLSPLSLLSPSFSLSFPLSLSLFLFLSLLCDSLKIGKLCKERIEVFFVIMTA